MKKLLLAIALCLVVGRAFGATRTISDAGGAWNVNTTWVEGVVPTNSDMVVGTSTSGNVTLPGHSGCLGLDLANYTKTISGSSYYILCYGGDVTLNASMTLSNKGLSLYNSTNLKTNGVTIGALEMNGASTSSYTLLDPISITNGLNLSAGNFSTGGYNITAGYFSSSNQNNRTINLLNSTIILTTNGTIFNMDTSSNATVNAGGSTIIMSGYNNTFFCGNNAGGVKPFNNLVFSGPYTALFNPAASLPVGNLSRIATIDLPSYFSIPRSPAINGTLTLQGYSSSDRLMLYGTTFGTPLFWNITGVTVNASNLDVRDIVFYDSVTNISITDDVWFDNVNPNNNYGAGVSATVNPALSNDSYLLKADLSGLNPSSISFVQLKVYESTRGGAHNLVAARMLKDWNEMNATYNKQNTTTGADWGIPGATQDGVDYTSINQSAEISNANPGWLTFDVTKATKDMLATNNYGWKVYAPANNIYDTFNTSEADSNVPYLLVYSSSLDLSAIPGGSGDCGGNTGVVFTPAKTWYWYKNTGSTSDISKWFDQTGGTGNASTYPPLPQDTARFDENSFDVATQAVTQDMLRFGSIDWTNSSRDSRFVVGIATGLYGSLIFRSNMTVTPTFSITFTGRGSFILDTQGKILYSPSFNNFDGVYTLQSDFESTYGFTVNYGTFDANGFNITSGYFDLDATNPHTVNMGNGTWRTSQTAGDSWLANQNNLILNAENSTVLFNSTQTGVVKLSFGNKEYNAVRLLGTSGGYSINILTGNDTFNEFEIGAGSVVNWTSDRNHAIGQFYSNGTVANPVVMYTNTSLPVNLTDTAGTNYAHYTNMSNISVSGGATWDATDHCVNVTGATGWLWEAVGGAVQAAKNWVSWDD